jgi:hypothetical protein
LRHHIEYIGKEASEIEEAEFLGVSDRSYGEYQKIRE